MSEPPDPVEEDMLPMSTAARRGWVVLRPQDASLMDPLVIDLLAKRLDGHVAAGEARLILDFKHVQYVSSSLIGALVAARGTAASAGGKLALCHLHPRLAELLKITRLDRMFEVYPDARSALDALAGE